MKSPFESGFTGAGPSASMVKPNLGPSGGDVVVASRGKGYLPGGNITRRTVSIEESISLGSLTSKEELEWDNLEDLPPSEEDSIPGKRVEG